MTDAFTAASNIVSEFIDMSTGENGLWEVFPEWYALSEMERSRHSFVLEKMVRGHIINVVASRSEPVTPCELTLYNTADEILNFVSLEYGIELDDLNERRETTSGISAIMGRHLWGSPQTPHVVRTDNASISVARAIRRRPRPNRAVSAVTDQLVGFLNSLDDILAVKGQMSGLAWTKVQEQREAFAKLIVSTLDALRDDEDKVGDTGTERPRQGAERQRSGEWVDPYSLAWITPTWLHALSAQVVEFFTDKDEDLTLPFSRDTINTTVTTVRDHIFDELGSMIGQLGSSVDPDAVERLSAKEARMLSRSFAMKVFDHLWLNELCSLQDSLHLPKKQVYDMLTEEFFKVLEPEAPTGGAETNPVEKKRREPWKMPAAVARQIIDALGERAADTDDFAELFREWYDLPEDVDTDTICEELIADVLEIGRERRHASEVIEGAPMSFVYESEGRVEARTAIPVGVYHTASRQGSGKGWVLEALDTDTGMLTSFSLKDIIRVNQ